MDGERFGLLEVLGRGAFGQVIKAVDKRRDHRVVALKIVPVPNDEAGKLRLQREASNLAKLNGHPNIVALHESFECMPGPSLCLVLDCLEGVTLAQQIERHGALKEEAGREVASQLASALTFMHSRGIVHRDLKADNIMSTRKCDAARAHWVLLDFGFSRSTVPALDTQLSLVGSEDWLAPEVHSLVRMSKAEKKPAFEDMLGAISPAVDCYALGLVMRYALTGVPPHLNHSSTRLTVAFPARLAGKHYRLKRLSSLSPMACAWLQGMMNVQPTTRFSAAAALQHAWLQSTQRAASAHGSALAGHVPKAGQDNSRSMNCIGG